MMLVQQRVDPVDIDPPFVSIVMPARNEEDYISQCLDSLVSMDYPVDRIEILVVDGMSEDATATIAAEFARRWPIVRLVRNPQRITPAAMNHGIAAAKGDVIVRVDAHALYPPSYVRALVSALSMYDVDVAGGVMITRPRSKAVLGRAIVAALTTPFGVGNSHFRTGTESPRLVDTVFGGAYRRSIIERVGKFNERLPRGQDFEFSMRIKQLGGRILLVPSVSCEYFARSDFRSFAMHNYQNGLWAVLPFMYSNVVPVSARHLVPLAFVIGGLSLGAIAAVMPPIGTVLLGLYVGSYLLAAVVASSLAASRQRDLALACLLPGIFATLHVMYGIGSLLGTIRVLWAKFSAPNPRQTQPK